MVDQYLFIGKNHTHVIVAHRRYVQIVHNIPAICLQQNKSITPLKKATPIDVVVMTDVLDDTVIGQVHDDSGVDPVILYNDLGAVIVEGYV
jgi:hypothetical protein